MKLTILALLVAAASTVSAGDHCVAADNPIRGECLADNGKSVGCSKGYCWKRCGEPEDKSEGLKGQWCWTSEISRPSTQTSTALFGDWIKCSKDSDCKESDFCGMNHTGGLCPTCGCGCHNTKEGVTWAGGDIEGDKVWARKGYDHNC
ncbi:hypothetical protein NUU61_008763 [Penicillium alfredii]|uniref:Uncharacterized protein n=1 Tax=Penicillium alfredii TaxID=1506179 RepID=A0A9W9EM14_9EURO|nr:uncharacterized protein NUU61_008763 [Penicillium alfredii]KAJ5084184.1 hypothetical protein NUU61_008763 [Penicillium alfredii]